MATDSWPSNAELIADCARLRYLRKEWRTLDPTWGYGTFWQQWRPEELVATDFDAAKSPTGESVDVQHLPYEDCSFDAVVFDPPYKLNGAAEVHLDERYGVHETVRWQDRMALIMAGVRECARVLGGGCLLVKCQDQVASGAVRWQTVEVTDVARDCGLHLEDRFDLLSYRPQPDGVSQKHARRNTSTLLVFTR